jgi:hypothetical protein
MTFDPNAFGPAIAAILGDGQRLASLGPGSQDEAFRDRLSGLDLSRELGTVRDRIAARACLAGLWLYRDFTEEAHEIAQEVHSPLGSAWHAIIHRREPDAWNSKYWWAQVGRSPWIDIVGYPDRSPAKFVDLCERVRGRGDAGEAECQAIQRREWQALFTECWRAAME